MYEYYTYHNTPQVFKNQNTTHTCKVKIETLNRKKTKQRVLVALKLFWDALIPEIQDIGVNPEHATEHYYTFRIPKHTQGFRQINAPQGLLKEAQAQLSKILQAYIPVHHNAYAYVPGKNHYDAVAKHQANNSKWFLKIDIKNFFPSCTTEIIYRQLQKLYVLNTEDPEITRLLKNIINICCLNNTLPQGSPASPVLSNLIFIDYDYKITELLKEYSHKFSKSNNRQNFVYTRYADDILISSKYDFNWKELVQELQNILGENFQINTTKTRYGSSAGRNWNLGLMLNQHNQITLGHEKKRKLKAIICNYITKYKNNEPICLAEKQHIAGLISYAKQVEPEYITYVLEHMSKKFDVDLHSILNS